MTKKRLLVPALILAAVAVAAVLLIVLGSGKEHVITLIDNIPGHDAPQTVKVRAGEAVTLPAPGVREGYVPDGWYTDEELTALWTAPADGLTQDLTLYAGWDVDTGDTPAASSNSDRSFAGLKTPGSQEEAYDYRLFFRPAIDGIKQPYVGDTMPYYEDGVYYIYYLKEDGDSYNHSIYLATTTDFLTYREYDDPIIEASRSGGQDNWVGTGSVVKVGDQYYFFYTGHNNAATQPEAERILVAVGDSPLHFEKRPDWHISPPDSLGQKQDFRDPQAYLDSDGNIILTVTASQANVARILKYTVTPSLNGIAYDGIIFTNPVGNFWNLECSDTFRLGDTWYITYSAQDDTLWYAAADQPYGPYGDPVRLDSKLFYAAKHVEDGENTYLVGWARRSESPSSTEDVAAWGGNLIVQKLVQRDDGSLALAPVDAIADSFTLRRELAAETSRVFLAAGAERVYADAFTCYESFKLTGSFTFTGEGSFGLSFDYMGQDAKKKLISVSPADGTVSLRFNNGSTLIAETAVNLTPGETYTFTYIQEGSVGTFYIDGLTALTVRVYGASGKTIRLFAENSAVQFTHLREYTRP